MPLENENDLYSRVDYRRVVAWPERIRREEPFLKRILAGAPEKSVLDLGCGTGEHTRFLAELGYRALGVDSSESMLEKALEQLSGANPRFVKTDLRDLEEAVADSFGASICLGNTLPHLVEEDHVKRFLAALARRLLPGGVALFQILNYEPVFGRGVRWLPLNFRSDEPGEIVFLRLMEPLPDGRVRFCPATLRYDAAADPPLQLVRSKLVELRGWRLNDLRRLLEEAGLQLEAIHGDMQGGEFLPDESQDLVLVARLRPASAPRPSP